MGCSRRPAIPAARSCTHAPAEPGATLSRMLRFETTLLCTTGCLLLLASACANGESFGRSDAGSRADAPMVGIDAPGVGVDAPTTGTDAPMVGVDAPVVGVDAPVVGTDAPVIGTDAPIVGIDAPTTGTGRYLDRCTSAAGCVSGLCTEDIGGTSFCTRTCTSDLVCAHEHICIGGVCLADDTGAPCSVGAPETCSAGLCLGSAAGGACTRNCASAAECPAGFACTFAGGSTSPICVNIETPCASAAECGSGLCIPGLGCTATCRTVGDCPATLPGLEYSCRVDLGSTSPICVPSADVFGDDPIGAVVSCPAIGTNTCRSGACDSDALPAPACVQRCTPQGGCPPGSGCWPADASFQVCERAGGRDLGSSCSNGRDCVSALCDATSSRCTRLCNDGICPTAWRCEPVAGFGIAICRP